MMAATNNQPASNWRNFAAWGAVGAAFYFLVVGGVTAFTLKDRGGVIGAILQSQQVAAILGLGLIFSMLVTGFTSRKRPLTSRTFRNFLIRDAVAIAACLLVVWSFSELRRTATMTPSVWAAAVTGATIIAIACLGSLAVASVHTRVNLLDDEDAAEEMRERGRLYAYSFVWMIACGLLLVVLALAGPAGLLPPATALVGALVLIATLTVLGIAVWRLNDELGRTLSNEAGAMGFYLILLCGGGWAMLAHLGFVAGPSPLDWLTLFTVLIFVASIIALGRRKLLIR